MRRLFLHVTVFAAGGLVALVLEWFVVDPRPWLFISQASIEHDPHLDLVVANYGGRAGQLVGGEAIIRFVHAECPHRGTITLRFRTAQVNGVYLPRFTRTPVALTTEHWDITSLQSAVEAAVAGPDCTRPKGPGDFLAGSRLVCQMSLVGRYGNGRSTPPINVSDELVPCLPLLGRLTRDAGL